jgi:hypothetical protein
MPSLNYETYKLLCKANIEVKAVLKDVGVKNWHELTYGLFKSSPLVNINDFWKIVSYTYSWIPTIPDIKPHLIRESNQFLGKLQKLKKDDDFYLPELIDELIPVINNSLVGVSKVLHFIAPDAVPIIDRNVLRGWDVFFFKLNCQFQVIQMPSYKTSLNRNHIQKYLAYRSILKEWVLNNKGQITLRDLEFAFFELGKNKVEERIELPTIKFE